jgi:hypothetical protein
MLGRWKLINPKVRQIWNCLSVIGWTKLDVEVSLNDIIHLGNIYNNMGPPGVEAIDDLFLARCLLLFVISFWYENELKLSMILDFLDSYTDVDIDVKYYFHLEMDARMNQNWQKSRDKILKFREKIRKVNFKMFQGEIQQSCIMMD